MTGLSWRDREKAILAPWAIWAAKSKGRKVPEAEHPYRSPFQRDRDRVIHSRAFRRLEYKTQVFVNHEGDHFRTRLTHTLEGAQIARTLARTLGANEDLCEAVILAHDLGHTPFGHSGERKLNELMKDHGGFEHNRHSVRIVEFLEDRYAAFPGLNLSHEVIEGLHKHPDPTKPGPPFHAMEAQIVDLADEIAYTNHDIDDGLESGILTWDQLKPVPAFAEALAEAESREPGIAPAKRRTQVVRVLIDRMVGDLVRAVEMRLSERGIKTLEDVRQKGERLVQFSEGFRKGFYGLKEFLFFQMYQHERVKSHADRHDRILEDLFGLYARKSELLPDKFRAWMKQEDQYRVVADYIAGMTDRYALEQHARHFGKVS